MQTECKHTALHSTQYWLFSLFYFHRKSTTTNNVARLYLCFFMMDFSAVSWRHARTRSGQNYVDAMQQSVLNYYLLYCEMNFVSWKCYVLCSCVLCVMVLCVFLLLFSSGRSFKCMHHTQNNTHSHALSHSHMKDIFIMISSPWKTRVLHSFCRWMHASVHLICVPCVDTLKLM